jgi:hypothetical protein
VHKNKKVPNNKPAKIIRENEKETCVNRCCNFGERIIFTFTVKGIKHYSMKGEIFGTELMRGCSVFFAE